MGRAFWSSIRSKHFNDFKILQIRENCEFFHWHILSVRKNNIEENRLWKLFRRTNLLVIVLAAGQMPGITVYNFLNSNCHLNDLQFGYIKNFISHWFNFGQEDILFFPNESIFLKTSSAYLLILPSFHLVIPF